MSKNKDLQASEAILNYLNKQNRPYSAVDIFNNLHKEYGKTAVVKYLETLTEEGKIKEKIYGKQKVYVADQGQFASVSDVELREMDLQIKQLTEEIQKQQECNRKIESELKTLRSAIKTEDARAELQTMTDECVKCNERLKIIKETNNTVSPEEKQKIMTKREKHVKEWRKRKRITNDIVNAILEGYPKSKKTLFEEVGIETDEDYSVKPPEL